VTAAEAREICLALPNATEDQPFGPDVTVYRVAGKLFALIPLEADPPTISLKCDPDLALAHRAAYAGVAPGWHLNKRHWNTVLLQADVPAEAVRQMVEDSFDLARPKGRPRKPG
jgi:predicted DNA-binding protein (MmcQ/YjbR family)